MNTTKKEVKKLEEENFKLKRLVKHYEDVEKAREKLSREGR